MATNPRNASIALWMLAACSEPPVDDPFASGVGSSPNGDDTGPTTASGATSGSDEPGGDDGSDDSGGGTIKLDVAAGTGDPGCVGEECDGCNAVDVLFVIDNSASMTSYQDNLIAAFPTFVGAMVTNLPANTDLHVGVTTSSFCGASNPSHGESNCVPNESPDVIASAFVTPDVDTVAGDGYQGRLRSASGMTWFAGNTGDAASMADLQAWFPAAAAVGSSGCSFEFNAAGAAYAFHPANAATNDGFVRDEGAVLLIFILSDESDQSLEVDQLQHLHDLVVEAKATCGGDDCIVSGGLLSEFCTPDLNAAHEFLSSFGEAPVWGSIGSIIGPPPDYSAVIGDALAQVVAQTCDQIPPAG